MREEFAAQIGGHPRLLAQGEQRAHLNPRGTHRASLGKPRRRSVGAREPERQPERGDLRHAHLVTRSVHRLVGIVEHQLAARRRVVAPRERTLDHEAVGPGALVAGKIRGQHGGRHDGEELRPAHHGHGHAEHVGRVDRHAIGMLSPVHVNTDASYAALGEVGEQARDVAWHARPHQHGVDTGEHRAEDRRRGRELDLLEQVDADEAAMALFGQPHLDEVRHHGEPLAVGGLAQRHLVDGAVRPSAGSATLEEESVGHAACQGLVGEGGQRAACVAVRVAVLQVSCQDDVEGGARHDAELTQTRHGAGELPARDASAHSALDHRWKCAGTHGTSFPTEP